jgi:hypothetical protein
MITSGFGFDRGSPFFFRDVDGKLGWGDSVSVTGSIEGGFDCFMGVSRWFVNSLEDNFGLLSVGKWRSSKVKGVPSEAVSSFFAFGD